VLHEPQHQRDLQSDCARLQVSLDERPGRGLRTPIERAGHHPSKASLGILSRISFGSSAVGGTSRDRLLAKPRRDLFERAAVPAFQEQPGVAVADLQIAATAGWARDAIAPLTLGLAAERPRKRCSGAETDAVHYPR